MARRYYGMNRGDHEPDVAEASSSPSKDLEVNVDLTNLGTGQGKLDKAQVITMLQFIINHILSTQTWPPA